MIDFEALECVSASGASVGIGVNGNSNEFCLPIGYIAEDLDAETKKEYFFQLYRLFKEYTRKNKLDEKNDLKDSNKSGTYAKEGGYSIKVKETEEETLLFTKVNFLDSILDAFNPHAIQNIANRKAYSEDFQFEDALNHLDDAVYLDNGAFMVDEAIVSQKQLLIKPTELAQMFCFIYLDVQTQLEKQDEVESFHAHLAAKFHEQYLFPQASLFEQDSFEQVKAILKERLEIIDHQTAIKDGDYFKLYDAIYAFLYGGAEQEGENTYWGIKDFNPIWEDLCLEKVYENKNNEMEFIFGDSKRDDIQSGSCSLQKEIFKIKQNNNQVPIRPDLLIKIAGKECFFNQTMRKDFKHHVYGNQLPEIFASYLTFQTDLNQNQNGYFTKKTLTNSTSVDGLLNGNYKLKTVPEYYFICDFKYKDSPPNVETTDYLKQLLYMQSLSKFSVSEFWLPCREDRDNCNDSIPSSFEEFKENTREEIKTRYINIQSLVKSYIGAKNEP